MCQKCKENFKLRKMFKFYILYEVRRPTDDPYCFLLCKGAELGKKKLYRKYGGNEVEFGWGEIRRFCMLVYTVGKV